MAKVESVFKDVVALKAEAATMEPDEDGCRWVFVLSVLGNPAACEACLEAGVDEPCDKDSPCTGGECCAACEHARWWVAANAELEMAGASLAYGDNDPCDVFAVFGPEEVESDAS